MRYLSCLGIQVGITVLCTSTALACVDKQHQVVHWQPCKLVLYTAYYKSANICRIIQSHDWRHIPRIISSFMYQGHQPWKRHAAEPRGSRNRNRSRSWSQLDVTSLLWFIYMKKGGDNNSFIDFPRSAMKEWRPHLQAWVAVRAKEIRCKESRAAWMPRKSTRDALPVTGAGQEG